MQWKSIELNTGAQFPLSPLTVVVGPNNAGKTRFLIEIERFLAGQDYDFKILKNIESGPADLDSLLAELGFSQETGPDRQLAIRGVRRSDELPSLNASIDTLNEIRDPLAKDGPTSAINFRRWFGKALVKRITTEDRLLAAKRIEYHAGNLKGLLGKFYDAGSAAEITISDFTKRVFGLQTKLDFSTPGVFCLRAAKIFSGIPADSRDAQPIFEKFGTVDEQGDGIRSLVTTLLMITLGREPLILVDEPEAFLHPPQAQELGKILADLASIDRPLICATHSVDILRGILSTTTNINILRLSRSDSGATARLIDVSEVKRISSSPVLSSSRVLDGLFYRGVIVAEADSDQALYERVASRYFRGDDFHYTHAHNKQTIHKLIEPYRSSGVPFAAVVDFDILRSTDEFAALAASAGVKDPPYVLQRQTLIQQELDGSSALTRETALIESLTELALANANSVDDESADKNILKLRRETKRLFEAADAWALAKKAGKAALTPSSATAFNELSEQCRAAGLFIVPTGDLEGWLEPLGYPRLANKSKWITGALTWLHENKLEESSGLLSFVREIHEHLLRV